MCSVQVQEVLGVRPIVRSSFGRWRLFTFELFAVFGAIFLKNGEGLYVLSRFVFIVGDIELCSQR